VSYDNCRNLRALMGYFFCQYAGKREFEIRATRQRVRNSIICYRKKKKQIDVSF